jgi:D-arabinose 1-dehydrogenase-like Zn-dependent alcohol dehydrogenase
LQGHHAVIFAHALSAQVFASISSNHKFDDIMKLSAYHVVVMGDKGELAKNLAFELDLIVSTRDAVHFYMLTEYMRYVNGLHFRRT